MGEVCGERLKVACASERHSAIMSPHRAQPGATRGNIRGSVLLELLCHMAFCLQPSSFLRATSEIKHCPHVLLTEPERKRTGGKNERETEPSRCQCGVSAASGPGTEPVWPFWFIHLGLIALRLCRGLRRKGCACAQLVLRTESCVRNKNSLFRSRYRNVLLLAI